MQYDIDKVEKKQYRIINSMKRMKQQNFPWIPIVLQSLVDNKYDDESTKKLQFC